VDGCGKGKVQAESYPESIADHVELLIESGLSKMDAIKACARARGVPKSVVYDEINKL